MTKLNYRSDFSFILRLHDAEGNDIGWPDYNWTARLWTAVKSAAFVAGVREGRPQNCFNDQGQIHVVCNNHGLAAGVLHCEFVAELPHDDYPDGDERIVVPMPLDIELVRDAAPCPRQAEVEMLLPYIRGRAFTFDDFSAGQIAQLQRPALEAADAAALAARQAGDAAAAALQVIADTNEANLQVQVNIAESNKLISSVNEQARCLAECIDHVTGSESARQQAEMLRQTDEEDRRAAEIDRQAAEAARAEAALHGCYTLEFGEEAVEVNDFNFSGGDIEVSVGAAVNVARLTLEGGAEAPVEMVPGDNVTAVIGEGVGAVWRVERISDGRPAAVGLRFKAAAPLLNR